MKTSVIPILEKGPADTKLWVVEEARKRKVYVDVDFFNLCGRFGVLIKSENQDFLDFIRNAAQIKREKEMAEADVEEEYDPFCHHINLRGGLY